MEIVMYLVPDWCFPRYQYSKKIRQDLAKRYKTLMKRLGKDDPLLEEDQSEFNNKTICIFLCKDLSSTEDFPSIQSVVSRTRDTIIKNELSNCHTLKDVFEAIPFKGNTYVITNSEDDIVTVPKKSNVRVIFIANAEKDRTGNYENVNEYQNIDMCSVEEISSVISTHLERYAFTGMKTACGNLVSIISETTLEDSCDRFKKTLLTTECEKEDIDIGTDEAKANNRRSQSAREKKRTAQIRNCVIRTRSLPEYDTTNQEEDIDIGTDEAKANNRRSQSAREKKRTAQIRNCLIRTRSLSEYDTTNQETRAAQISNCVIRTRSLSEYDKTNQELTSLSRSKRGMNFIKQQQNIKKEKTNGKRTALSEEDKDSVERLVDEIVGMFNRSNLPKNEHPHLHGDSNKKVNERLLNELQQLDDTIQSCGYRFSTFHVSVKEGSFSESLYQQIKHLLKRYNITEFKIVSSNINRFTTCYVGRKLAVNTRTSNVSGTLGGFARTSSGDTERTWALMSRHVANLSSDGKVYVTSGEKGENRKVATIMKQVNEDETEKQYLDIAAACLDHEIVCDTKYITEENTSVKGKLSEYDAQKLRGLPVHIKGASTPLGLGTITILEQTSVQNDGLCENYIVVEDRAEKGAFCKAGDSGAIVCAENPDRYGEEVQLISMVVGENCSRKGSYTTLRLDKGLDELNVLTEKKFDLC